MPTLFPEARIYRYPADADHNQLVINNPKQPVLFPHSERGFEDILTAKFDGVSAFAVSG